MKKLNQKGFTLIEIIGAVTILSIITILALNAYTSYLDWSRKKALDNMAKSASTAAEQYIMDYPHKTIEQGRATELTRDNIDQYSVTFEELVGLGYLSDTNDPMGGGNCTGRVVIGSMPPDPNNKRALEKYMFVVHECCSAYHARYVYSYDTKTYEEKDSNGNKILVERLEPIETVSKKAAICD